MNLDYYYDKVIKEIKCTSDSEQFIATGLTCNIDTVFKLEKLHVKSKYIEVLRLPETIKDLDDFAQTIAYHSIKECGAEYTYDIPVVFEWAKNNYKSEMKIGGTGAQAANALSAIGRKVLFHCPELNYNVAALLEEKNIYIPLDKLVKPSEGLNSRLPNQHYIFEVNKQTKISFKDKTIFCNRENRIMIRPEEELFIDNKYFDYIEKNTDKITSILISGFNAANSFKELNEKLTVIEEKICRLKNIKPNMQVYVENGDSNIPGFKEKMFWGITKFADIVGMNENEFEYIADIEGIMIDYKKVDELVEGIRKIYLKMEKVSCFVVHTRDYTIGVTRKNSNIFKLRDSIIAGNLFATCRAATGKFSSFKELVEIAENTDFSKEGCEAVHSLFDDGKIQENLCGLLNNNINFTLIPTKILEIPVCTVGLGDSFVAGYLSLT